MATKEDKVEVFVPRGDVNGDPNLFISVNGKNYLLPRGKTSTVPKCIADEYYRSLKAQGKFDDTVDSLRSK